MSDPSSFPPGTPGTPGTPQPEPVQERAPARSIRPPAALLISEGDLPALAAVAMQQDPASVVLWSPLATGFIAARTMTLRHRDLLDCAIAADAPWAADEGDVLTMLMQAVAIARTAGARRIIWPVRYGPDRPETEAALRTAATISGLTALWHRSARGSSPKVEIDCPFADLDPDQVVDLADDAGAPMSLFWPCEQRERDAPCGICSGCRLWAEAFAERELQWPFGEIAGEPAGR